MGSGLKTAVELALARTEGERPAMAAEQLSLLPTLAPEGAPEPPEGPGARRGAGRPPGARNRRTEAWTNYILGRYHSPLEVLAETYSRPVEVLAAELGCTRLEAWQEQRRCAEALAPYVHQRQPQAVEVDGRGVMQLVIEASGAGGAAAVSDGAIEARVLAAAEIVPIGEIEQNQRVDESDRARVGQYLLDDQEMRCENSELDEKTR